MSLGRMALSGEGTGSMAISANALLHVMTTQRGQTRAPRSFCHEYCPPEVHAHLPLTTRIHQWPCGTRTPGY